MEWTERAENAVRMRNIALVSRKYFTSQGAKCERVNGIFIGHMCVNWTDSGSAVNKC